MDYNGVINMLAIDSKYLVMLSLKYRSSAKPLKTIAFAQLSAKALYLLQHPSDINQISSQTAKLIGIPKVSKPLIEDGLKYLEEINKVKNNNKKWFLTKEERNEIKDDMISRQKELSGVLKRHFPADIEKEKLTKWFNEAAANFFGYHSEEWIKSVCTGQNGKFKKPLTINELLSSSIEKFKFQHIKQTLIDGFVAFLSSEDLLDQQYLMSFGMGMFSSRLVAADVGVDPMTIEELKGCKLLLDTNILFALIIEKHRMAKSLRALGNALKTIGAKPIYLYTTKEEYGRALSGRRGDILSLFDVYPKEVIEDTFDDFIVTAKARHCKTKEDFIIFFDSLIEIPKTFSNGYLIKEEDYVEINTVVKEAERDQKLKEQIQQSYIKLRTYWKREKKSNLALNHDAALLKTADLLKELDGKCIVLSLDKTLQDCASKLAGPHEIPKVISIDVLIEILAINSAGPDLEASNFAPLLSSIILNQCLPPTNTYTTLDLHWLYKIHRTATKLPPEDTKEIVKEINRARYGGRMSNDRKIELKVNRMFQEKELTITNEIEEMRDRVKVAEEASKREHVIREKSELRLVEKEIEDVKRNALLNFIKQTILRFIIIILLGLGIYFLLKLYIIPNNKLLDVVISFGPSFISFILWMREPYIEYFNDIKSAPITAKNNLEIKK